MHTHQHMHTQYSFINMRVRSEWTEDGQLWVQYVSSTPATRLDVINLQVCAYLCTVYVCMYMYLCMHVFINAEYVSRTSVTRLDVINLQVCTYLYTRVYICIYVHIYIYIHIHMHVHE